MDKVLFISAHFPSPLAPYAGHKTAYRFLKEYAETNLVDLITICNDYEINISHLKGLNNLNMIRTYPLTPIKKLKNIIFSPRSLPLKAKTRFINDVLKFLKENLKKYDIINFEFTHSASYLPFIKNIISNQQTVIVSSHDILIQRKLRDIRRETYNPINIIDISNTFNFEKEIYTLSSKIRVQSEKDKNLIEILYDVTGKVEVSSPYLSSFIQEAKNLRSRKTIESKSLLFWGAMDRKENIEAVEAFLKLFGEFIKANDLKLYIVGNNPPNKIRSLSSNNIIITGFVKNPANYFAKCQIGIVPLLSGAGVKVKTLEMLEAGLPVISTPVGAEGIKHKNLYVCELKNFSKYILKLIEEDKF